MNNVRKRKDDYSPAKDAPKLFSFWIKRIKWGTKHSELALKNE